VLPIQLGEIQCIRHQIPPGKVADLAPPPCLAVTSRVNR
jgi:hypothetical protein